jgi:dihydrofolate synthase/folylpolyglutamate synthase
VDFAAAIRELEAALKFGIDPSLAGIRTLTEAMGRPQDSLASVQTTGTNGKSSTTRLVAALLAAEGLCTAAYTSPHLESYTERIELAGAPVGEGDFALAMTAAVEVAAAVSRGARSFTEFELLTAAALWLMRERGVDVACLEVGMGGRWDSTSVVDPSVAVITGVGLDHTERLGSTVEAIATDKAQIIKPGASVVLGPGTVGVAGILLERAAGFDLHPRFVAAGNDPSPVDEALTVRYGVRARPDRPGGTLVLDVRGIHAEYAGLELTAPAYQAPNVATAVAAAECALGRALDVAAARRALVALTFPGRFELLAANPPLVIDGAHNPQAAGVLATAILDAWPDDRARPLCVLGVLTDKDAAGIVRALAPAVDGFVVTQPDSPRVRDAADLAAVVEFETGSWPEIRPELADALAHARTHTGTGGVIVTGSLYTAGQVRTLVRAAL